MSIHINDEQIVGYIHHTLNDAERETLDRHLDACPDCRTRLDAFALVQRQIRNGLSSALNAVHSSSRIRFVTAAPALKRRRVFKWFELALSNVMLLVVVVIQITMFAALFKSAADPVAGSSRTLGGVLSETQPRDLSLAQDYAINSANRHLLVPGWVAFEQQPGQYEMWVDSTIAHTGQGSGTIRAIASPPSGTGMLVQVFRADDYCGQKLRLVAQVKRQDVKGQAGVWMSVDGPETAGSVLENVSRSWPTWVTGTTDWQRLEIVLDVPKGSETIAFGALLKGGGQVWIDDFEIEIVGSSIPTSD